LIFDLKARILITLSKTILKFETIKIKIMQLKFSPIAIALVCVLFFVSSASAQNARKTNVSAPQTKNVVIIVMDGYRWQELFKGADSSLLFGKKYSSQDSVWRVEKYWAKDEKTRREKLMPFVWNQISQKGQIYGNRDMGNLVNVKNKYWFSEPGRSETFCGYYDSLINSNDKIDNPNENVIEFINKQKGFKGKVATFASWDVVPWILNRNRNGMLVNIYGEDIKGANLTPLQKEANAMQHYVADIFGQGERPDANTFSLANAYVKANKPRVLYIDFGDNDELAHEGRYDLYLDAAHKIDAMIKDLWNHMQQDPFYKDQTTLMIFPDHGRGLGDEWTSHGTKTARSNETYLMVMGPDTPALGEVKVKDQIYQDQFAQTLANFLGFHFTANHPVAAPVKSVMK
jgi:hypothetical protein